MIYDDAQDLVARIVAQGVRATTDPKRLDPPGALVFPEAAQFDSMCEGRGATDWVVVLLSPQPGGHEAFRTLSQMAAAVLKAIPRIDSLQATSYRTSNDTEWPCYEMRFTTESSWI
jgi:hypothetical protein